MKCRSGLVFVLMSSALALAGCGNSQAVNPPTEPAKAIQSPVADMASETPEGSIGALMPGQGPGSFMGRWTPNVEWCANTQGTNRPTEITIARFEAPDRACDITRIQQTRTGYLATLTCAAPARPAQERLLLTATGQALNMTYLDRPGTDAMVLTKCTTLSDVTTKAPALPTP